MSITAMKTALSALCAYKASILKFGLKFGTGYAAITALRTAIQEAEACEPVAHVEIKHMVGVRFHENCDYGCSLEDGALLYLTPQPAPKQEPIPAGYQLVPVEVVNLFNFMDTSFVAMTSQQEQIKISLDIARKAMLAAAPAQAGAQPAPDGYALISIAMLRTWGVYEDVIEQCQYPAAPVQAQERKPLQSTTGS